MPKLVNTAQALMDMYYQNYKTDEDFFDLTHFRYLCGVVYSKILEDEYKEARAIAKAETGYTEISLQSDWLQEIEVEIKESDDPYEQGDMVAKLPFRPFSFPYDPYSFGIQSIIPKRAGGCKNFVRSSQKSEWIDCLMPNNSNIYWMMSSAKKLRFKNVKCDLGDKVKLLYIPEITDEAFGLDGGDVPASKEEMIIMRGLQLMMAARQGTVVDFTNNSNPNKTIQTEIDTAFGNIKTKPI